MPAKSSIVRHHLLEIILWPDGDNGMRRISHTAAELKELGIYGVELTIPISRADHARLHAPEKCGIKRDAASRQKMSISAKKSYIAGGHRGGTKFKGWKWKTVNGRRVWYVS